MLICRNYCHVDQVALNKFINDNVNNEANQANITDIVCHQCDVCEMEQDRRYDFKFISYAAYT